MSEIILSWWQLHIHRFTIALFDYTASYQIRVSEWIYTLIVAWISKPLAQNRCDIWSLNANTRPFSQTEPTIELCWKGWFVWYIWLYVLVISRTRFRVNPNSLYVVHLTICFLPCHVRVLEWTQFKHFTFTATFTCSRMTLLTSEHQGVGVGILLKK